jgi:glycosyltransferase involved in cell wall biosynthesis
MDLEQLIRRWLDRRVGLGGARRRQSCRQNQGTDRHLAVSLRVCNYTIDGFGSWKDGRLYKDHRITVVIPCLNEEQGIAEVLRRMPPFVDEVIVVDNASTDRTAEVARNLGAIVIREDVRGYGRSYKKGFSMATGDIIVTLDGDHSYPPDAISYLLEAFFHLEADFLNASRFPVRDPRAMSFKHKIGNLILSLAMSLLFFRWVRDSQSGMWVFRRSILQNMKLVSDGMAFSEEIKIEALLQPGLRFEEISILYSSRLGEIKLNPWRDGLYNLWFLVKKRFARR